MASVRHETDTKQQIGQDGKIEPSMLLSSWLCLDMDLLNLVDEKMFNLDVAPHSNSGK